MELTRPVGTNEITPVVHNGVMFVNSHRTVLGIDVESSEIRWKYVRASDTRQVGPPISQPRGFGIYRDRLFVPTVDNHTLALNIHSGELSGIKPSPACNTRCGSPQVPLSFTVK
jgi:alcohol dehydrogenase (cytochrome c)